MFKKFSQINVLQIVKNIIVIVALVVLIFFDINYYVGHSSSNNDSEATITSDILTEQIQGISELATTEYNYTNMGLYEKSNNVKVFMFETKVPLSTKSFIVSYDGIIKAGIDMSQVDVNLTDNTITINMPEATVLSHEIDEDSLEIYDESDGVFNPITLSDYNDFVKDQKADAKERAIEKGLLTKATDEAQSVIETFIIQANDLDDDYEIEFNIIEEE
ncbi:MAG: DUF4230 domain-containing protein [Erysipelotrichaceae bacterium]|nr:DUF4230 domain-containing protein [Erysipelotrichaceae bacterium]